MTKTRKVVKTKVVKAIRSKHNKYVYGIVRVVLPKSWVNKRVRITIEQQP